MRNILLIIVLFVVSSCWPSRVSFRDGSVPPEWKRFMVTTFENKASNAPISYSSELTELVKDAIQSRAGLRLVSDEEDDPQLIITGTVSSYTITPLSLQDTDTEVKNRLTIRANFEIFVSEPKEDVMQISSARFADFDASQDVGTIQDQLLAQISEEIVQDIINKLLSNW